MERENSSGWEVMRGRPQPVHRRGAESKVVKQSRQNAGIGCNLARKRGWVHAQAYIPPAQEISFLQKLPYIDAMQNKEKIYEF